MTKINENTRRGFTLIELLATIAIIGILSTIILTSLGGARLKARDARRQSNMRQIGLAMEMCYDDANCGNQQYATDSCGLTGLNELSDKIGPVSKTTFLITPKDPVNVDPQIYKCATSTTQYYCFYARLEAPASTTYVCASNKGNKMLETNFPPTAEDCCGFDVTQ